MSIISFAFAASMAWFLFMMSNGLMSWAVKRDAEAPLFCLILAFVFLLVAFLLFGIILAAGVT